MQKKSRNFNLIQNLNEMFLQKSKGNMIFYKQKLIDFVYSLNKYDDLMIQLFLNFYKNNRTDHFIFYLYIR